MSDGRRDMFGGKGWGGEIVVSRDGEPIGQVGGDAGTPALPDPYVLRCPQCRWTGAPGDGMTHPRQGYAVCPQCWRLGYESMLERVSVSEMPPMGREY